MGFRFWHAKFDEYIFSNFEIKLILFFALHFCKRPIFLLIANERTYLDIRYIRTYVNDLRL